MIITLYINQLKKIKEIKEKNIKFIFTPILTPIHLKNDLNLLNNFEKNRIDLINKINLNLKNYEHADFVFLDLVSIMQDYNVSDIFIDDCCHLSSKGSEIIAKNLIKLFINLKGIKIYF